MSATHRDPVPVIIADDHPLFLEGVQRLFERAPDLAVLGVASTGSQAIALVTACRPAVAVLDISMPEMNGIDVLKALASRAPATQCIMLSGFEEQGIMSQAIAAGARGYVLKRSASENLLMAIRSVHAGGFYLDPALASRLVPRMHRSALGPASPSSPGLTAREEEVLRLIAMGYTLKEVAGTLGVTSKSIETYKLRAAEKLKLGSRAKIVEFAMTQGWFQPNETTAPVRGASSRGLASPSILPACTAALSDRVTPHAPKERSEPS